MPKRLHRFATESTRWQHAPIKPAFLVLGLLACTATVAVRLKQSLSPKALWLDDQWVAALVRHASFFDLFHLLPPAPLGFITLLKMAAMVGGGAPGDAAWPLQMLPLAAALVQIPLIGWLAWRVTGSSALGILAAILLCESRTFLVQAARVKQYTLESVITLLLIAAVVHFVTRPSRGRFLTLPALAAASLPFSFTALPVGMVAVLFVTLHAIRTMPRPAAEMQRFAARHIILLSSAAYGLCALLWTAAIQLRQSNRSMSAFWSDHYLPLTDPAGCAAFFTTNVMRMLGGVFPTGYAFLAAAVPLAIFVMMLRRATRLAAAAALLMYGGMLFAAALQLYPIGGGRTDIFSYPITILTLIGGLACIGRPGRILGGVALTILSLRMLLLFPGEIITYPLPSGRGAINAAISEHAPPDVLLISPDSTWALALYTDVPVRLLRASEASNGFIALPEAPNFVQLRRGSEEAMRRQARAITEASPARIILLITFSIHSDEFVTRAAITEAGYRETTIFSDDGLVIVFTREPPSEVATSTAHAPPPAAHAGRRGR